MPDTGQTGWVKGVAKGNRRRCSEKRIAAGQKFIQGAESVAIRIEAGITGIGGIKRGIGRLESVGQPVVVVVGIAGIAFAIVIEILLQGIVREDAVVRVIAYPVSIGVGNRNRSRWVQLPQSNGRASVNIRADRSAL